MDGNYNTADYESQATLRFDLVQKLSNETLSFETIATGDTLYIKLIQIPTILALFIEPPNGWLSIDLENRSEIHLMTLELLTKNTNSWPNA